MVSGCCNSNRFRSKDRNWRWSFSFIGFAPADKPAVVVSVTLQDPKNGRYGGLLGGPVFKRVSSFALQSRQVPPTSKSGPTLRLTYRP